MQYQFVRKKKTVHPAVPNSDTLVYSSVTVYPRGVQPFAIAGRMNFIYMKYGRQ